MDTIQASVLTADEIHDIIVNLQDTSGTNDKKEILEAYVGHQELYRYFNYVYDEVNFVYGKSKVPEIPQVPPYLRADEDLSEMYALLEDMNDGTLKGKTSDQAMIDYCVGKEPFYEELLFFVIKRKLKAGINAKGINEVFGRVIPISPYQRCESESYMKTRIIYETDGDKHGALAQTKADGSFLNVVVTPGKDRILASTRYGRDSQSCKFFDMLAVIGLSLTEKSVIHGEALIKNPDGTIMDRAKGNGKINKFNKRDGTVRSMIKKISETKSAKTREKLENELVEFKEECVYISQNIVYEVWDIVPYECWMNLECPKTVIERFVQISTLVADFNKDNTTIGNCELRLTDSRVVYNNEEAMDFYQEQLDKGLEGMVIKNLGATWEHDSNRQGIIKLKDFKENDFIIVGYTMADADSTFAGGIGALIMESSEGTINVNVSGMARKDRGLERVDMNDSSKGLQVIDGFDFDQFTGKVAAVKYNEMSLSKTGNYSLFLPNVLEIRDSSDKSFPDTFEKIKKDAKFKG